MRITVNRIFLLLIIIFTYSCITKKSGNCNIANLKEQVKDSVLYEFINYLVDNPDRNPNIRCTKIVSDSQLDMPFPFILKKDSIELTKMTDFLSKKDIKYIFSQKKEFDNFDLNPKLIKHASKSNKNSLKYINPPFCTISYPLFNIDKTKVIIRTSYSDCRLCSVGGVYLYEKRNSKWVLIKKISGWIS